VTFFTKQKDIALTDEIIKSCKLGNLKEIDLWLSEHPVDAVDKFGRTLSCYAAIYQRKELIHLLIENGADFNKKDILSNNTFYYDKHPLTIEDKSEIDYLMLIDLIKE